MNRPNCMKNKICKQQTSTTQELKQANKINIANKARNKNNSTQNTTMKTKREREIILLKKALVFQLKVIESNFSIRRKQQQQQH